MYTRFNALEKKYTMHQDGPSVHIPPDAPGAEFLKYTGSAYQRDITVEQLRERLSTLLRRYVPPVTLPTPIPHIEEATESERSSSCKNPDQTYTPGVDRPL